MEIFDNSEIKDVLDLLMDSEQEAIKLCWEHKVNDDNPEVTCMCEYIINLYESEKLTLTEIMKEYYGCDKFSIASEMMRLLNGLKLKKDNKVKIIVNEIKDLICSLALHIKNESKMEKDGNVPADSWMNGLILRGLALNLAYHYNNEGDFENELLLLGVRASITVNIMSSYHHFVGPSIIDYADCLLKMNRNEEALKYYNAVVVDFKWFIEEYKEKKEITVEEDYYSMKSLQSALIGIKSIKDEDKDIMGMLNDVEIIISNYDFK